jgi:hypothetical protein
MADLDQVLAAVLGSLANARRMADEQTSAIAQYYQANPLLKGMTVPRIRLPEVVIDLPLIVDGVEEGQAPVVADTHTIVKAALDALADKAKDQSLNLPSATREAWGRALLPVVERAVADGASGRASFSVVQESVAAAAEQVLHPLLGQLGQPSTRLKARADVASQATLNATQKAAVLSAVKAAIRDVAIKSPGRSATLKASVLTADIKDKAGPDSVTRLKLVLREEGMEWQEIKRADGSSSAALTPE